MNSCPFLYFHLQIMPTVYTTYRYSMSYDVMPYIILYTFSVKAQLFSFLAHTHAHKFNFMFIYIDCVYTISYIQVHIILYIVRAMHVYTYNTSTHYTREPQDICITLILYTLYIYIQFPRIFTVIFHSTAINHFDIHVAAQRYNNNLAGGVLLFKIKNKKLFPRTVIYIRPARYIRDL